MTGITNRAMAMDPTAPSNTPTNLTSDPKAGIGADPIMATSASSSASSGSGLGPMGDPQRVKGIDEQNERQLQEGIKASMQTTASSNQKKRAVEDAADDSARYKKKR